MSDGFHEGDKVWIEQPDGSQRPAVFVGEADTTWFGGASSVYVVYPDTHNGERVPATVVIPRDDEPNGD